MTSEVRIARHADRALARLSPPLQERIENAMQVLKEDPYTPRPGADIRLLRGQRGYHRLRVGQHRVFYVVFAAERVVVVTDVRHRSRAYNRP